MSCTDNLESEESLIWREIKKSASAINKVGGNTISLLLWSKGKSLMEVQRRINLIISTKGECQVKSTVMNGKE